jgi:hypothetical protein
LAFCGPFTSTQNLSLGSKAADIPSQELTVGGGGVGNWRPQTMPFVEEATAFDFDAPFCFSQQFDGGVHAKWVQPGVD